MRVTWRDLHDLRDLGDFDKNEVNIYKKGHVTSEFWGFYVNVVVYNVFTVEYFTPINFPVFFKYFLFPSERRA